METLTLRPVPNLGKAPDQYLIDLLDGSYAVLTRFDDVWSVTEHKKTSPVIDRGLFGSPEDALEVFRSEVAARLSVEKLDTA
jgi:hypothetical protein